MVKFLKDPTGFSQLSVFSKIVKIPFNGTVTVKSRNNFLKPGEGFMFQLGKGEVIKGWDLVRN